MIVTNIMDIDTYKGLDKNLDLAFDYLKSTNIDTLEDGKVFIAGEDIYSIVSTCNTREHDESQYEIHQKYIDIQYILSGEEIIYCSDKNTLEVINEYSEETDKQNLEGNSDSIKIHLKSKMLAVFYPNDAHKACCKVDEISTVRKLLIKVKLNLLVRH